MKECYFQVFDFARGEHHVFEYWHHAQHYIQERADPSPTNIILIECVRGDYARAAFQELKNGGNMKNE